jgi:hypothetical protein
VRAAWCGVVAVGALAGAAMAERRAFAEADAVVTPPASLMTPELPRGMTRVRGVTRPFFNVVGQGGGAITDFAVDHYFHDWPLRLSLEATPVALAVQSDGTGTIGHFRASAAYATDYLEVGAGVGSRVQHFGAGGISIAGSLRLGALDGLKLALTYGYALRRNQYTGRAALGMSNVLGTIDVPLTPRITLVFDGAFSFDRWMYAMLGLKHRLSGDGGAGTWIAYGAFGFAWVMDRPDCTYPDTVSCSGSAWGVGPTIGFGLERRF